MLHASLDFTVCSTDPKHYNRISVKLPAPITRLSKVLVSSLIANNDIIVLNPDDYIQINGKQYSLNKSYSSTAISNNETLAALLDRLFDAQDAGINVSTDETSRCVFKSLNPFHIDRMTYNFELLTGFYNSSLPVYADFKDDYYFITSESVGFVYSTPILYLLSNVGYQSYRTVNNTDIAGSRIVMRLQNTYQANVPIIANNADFVFTVPSNDLAMLEFTLTDANLHELKMLSPMYLIINIQAVPGELIIPPIFTEPTMNASAFDKKQMTPNNNKNNI